MKRIKLFIPALICTIFLSVGCNNSGGENKPTNQDSASPRDTIKSDPSKFSNPH